MQLKSVLLGIALLAATTVANAAVIGFNNLKGPNGQVFRSTTEAGFNVIAGSKGWKEGFNVGAGIPSLYNFTGNGEMLRVSAVGGGTFSFDSIDFGTGGRGSYSYTLTGLLGTAKAFVQTGTFVGSYRGGFQTVLGKSSAAIDMLTLKISNFRISSVNVDNIGVRTVPEPASLALLAIGLAVLAFGSRKRA